MKMNSTEYERLLNELLKEIVELRKQKGSEYSGDDNIFINFLNASLRRNKTPEMILYDWMDKQINSVDMHINHIVRLDYTKLREKIKDIFIYLTLLLAMNKDEDKENWI